MRRGTVLPELHRRTLHDGDFFAIAPDAAQVDVVVGNPPWSSRRGGSHTSLTWCRRAGLPAPGREQAWPFVWKSLRHLRENGVVAFLLPATGFLHNHAGHAVEARKRLMREARVFSVVNFADMRFQLFDGAVRPAALILFGRPAVRGAAYRFDYLTPKADLNLKSRRLITIGSADKCRLDSRMVDADPSIFKKRLWMSEPEARLFNYLAQFPRLGDIVVAFGTLSRRKESTKNRWIIGQGFQPVDPARLSDSATSREKSDFVGRVPHLPIAEFRSPVQTSGRLSPWRDTAVRRRGFEQGFGGPRVLVPRGIAAGGGHGGPRLRAAYVEDRLTFQDIIQAIVVPPGDERRGMLLAGLLNSKLMLWFAFHGTSSFGSDRPEVKQAELLRLPFPAVDDMPGPERSRSAADALVATIEKQARPADQVFERQSSESGWLKELDRLACDFFGLSEEERTLVEDTVEQIVPAVQPLRSAFPEVWRPSTPSDRRAYARTLVDSLADWFDGDRAIGTRLEARNDDLAILRLSLRDAPGGFDYADGLQATRRPWRQCCPASVITSISRFRATSSRCLTSGCSSTATCSSSSRSGNGSGSDRRLWPTPTLSWSICTCGRIPVVTVVTRIPPDAGWQADRVGGPLTVVGHPLSAARGSGLATVSSYPAGSGGRRQHHVQPRGFQRPRETRRTRTGNRARRGNRETRSPSARRHASPVVTVGGRAT